MSEQKNNKKATTGHKLSPLDFLEPIEYDSIIRHQLLKLFTDSGLDDFAAQIFLSIILHGGHLKPKTLAKDIHCSPSRLELPDGLQQLVELDLISTTHHRPKTIILTKSIEELLKLLESYSLVNKGHLSPEKVHDLLLRLENLCNVQITEKDNNNRRIIEDSGHPLFLLLYFDKLLLLSQKIRSLFYLLDYSFVSLHMERNESIILSSLICNGGKVIKREFYLNEIKNFCSSDLNIDKNILFNDLSQLGYVKEEIEEMTKSIVAFYQKKLIRLQFSTEQYFNIILNNLSEYSHSTSMGKHKKSKKGKFVSLTLVKPISQIGFSIYQPFVDFSKNHKTNLQIVKMAYLNVKLIDKDIFISSIADSSSTRKRIRKDISHAKEIYISIIHENFVEDILKELFVSTKKDYIINFLVALELKEFFVEKMQKYIEKIDGKRGILIQDNISFISRDEIPQDVLIDNTLLLIFDVGSSMITIHDEITKNNPTDINMIKTDVDYALKNFNEILNKIKSNKITIQNLIKK